MKRSKCKISDCKELVVRHRVTGKDKVIHVSEDEYCSFHRFQATHDIIANVARRVK